MFLCNATIASRINQEQLIFCSTVQWLQEKLFVADFPWKTFYKAGFWRFRHLAYPNASRACTQLLLCQAVLSANWKSGVRGCVLHFLRWNFSTKLKRIQITLDAARLDIASRYSSQLAVPCLGYIGIHLYSQQSQIREIYWYSVFVQVVLSSYNQHMVSGLI